MGIGYITIIERNSLSIKTTVIYVASNALGKKPIQRKIVIVLPIFLLVSS